MQVEGTGSGPSSFSRSPSPQSAEHFGLSPGPEGGSSSGQPCLGSPFSQPTHLPGLLGRLLRGREKHVGGEEGSDVQKAGLSSCVEGSSDTPVLPALTII